MSRLIGFFLTQRTLVLLMVVGLIAGGWMSFLKTPIDAFPDVSPVQVKLIFKAPGMTPTEVEQRVIAPLESELLGLPNQSSLRSLAKYAIADITLDFSEGTDVYWARQQVAERLGQVDLPSGVSGGMTPLSTPLSDVYMFTIEGNTLSDMEKRSLLDWVIRPALRSVKGVADVNSLGGKVQIFQVQPDYDRLQSYGITLEQLTAAIEVNNQNDGAGRVNQGEEVLLVRTLGKLQTINDIESVIVGYQNDLPILVKDIAKVKIDAMYRNGAVTQNGQSEAVQGLVIALRGANAKEVISGIEAKLDELQPALPEGIHINVFYNRADLVNKAVNTVSKALVEAIVLVVLVLLLFLGNIRAAITVALILPLAALSTFILMNYFGLSANLMSLGGLAIAVGMLVDAAVVVVENIVTTQEKDKTNLPKLHLIYRALQEVMVPVISGILIIMTVFLPLLTLEGLEGKLFIPVALTIIFALGSSLILSLTLIPTLASFILGKPSHQEPWLMRKLHSVYLPVLKWSLKHDLLVISTAIVALVAAGMIYTQVGKTFMPQMDEGNVILQIEKTPSIGLDETVRMDLQIQKRLLEKVPEIEQLIARVGSDELGLDPMSLNDTDTFMVLKPQSEWRMADKEALVDEIRQVMESDFPGMNFAFTQPIQMRTDEMLTGARGDIAIKIFGDNPKTLNNLADQLVSEVSQIEGAIDVYTPKNDGSRYLQLQVNRAMAAQLSMTVSEVEELLRIQIDGMPIGTIFKGIQRIPILIRGSEQSKQSIMEMLHQPVILDDGNSIRLSQLVEAEEVSGPVSVNRDMGKRYATVIANVQGRDLVGFVDEAKILARQLNLPTGYYFEWGGQFENQQRAAEKLSIVVPIALLLIFIILFSTFRSIGQAVMVLTNIPLALIGGIIALWLTGEYLSVPASVGFIALLGIAVLNGVVMVSYFNQLQAQGLPIGEVVLQGAMRRLRPVLMTASIAALGLLPLVFASGVGSEIQRPLAIVVIGGLISSTILTLLVLPIIYRRFRSLASKRSVISGEPA